MFENETYEAILQRMLDRVPNDIDKREGSIIYDALAPAAAELAQMYAGLDIILRLGFGETSSGEYLDLRANDRGITRKPSTPAIRKGLFYDSNNKPVNVPIGSKFLCEDIIFIVRSKLEDGVFELECETKGKIGNTVFGQLSPVEHIDGLETAELTDILIPGEDEESDESLRNRYLQAVREPGTSGNVADYKRWAAEVAGVGAAKVIPLWRGPGTVKIIIVDTNKRPANGELVNKVAEHIEKVRPICSDVTVTSAIGKPINVSATVVLARGYSLSSVQDEFHSLLNQHFSEISFSTTYVSYAKIGTILLSTPGVIDYSNLLLNDNTVNIPIQEDEVPVIGMINLGV